LRKITAELLKVHQHLDLEVDLVPAVAGPVRRYRLRYGTVDELDGSLRHHRALPMVVPPTMGLLAVAPTMEVAAVTDDNVVHLLSQDERDGHDVAVAVAVAGADTATFLPDGRILLTAPRPDRAHEVILADTATGHVLHRSVLGVTSAVVTATPHPHDGSVVLDAGMGDDGSVLYVARVEDGALLVERIAGDMYAGGFPPAGDRLLLLPHPNADDVSVLSWPDRRPIASLAPDGAHLDDDDGFDLGCFLDDGQILLKTFGSGILLCSAGLEPTAWVGLDLAPVIGAGEPELSTVLGLSADTIAVDVWDGEHLVPTVWWIDDDHRRPVLTGTDELSTRLGRVAGKLSRARELYLARDPGEPAMFGADAHHFRLGPPLPEETVAAFERAHGVTLPPDYRAFTTRLGHGGPGGSPGAGPFYGVEALDDWTLGLRRIPGSDTLATPFAAVPGMDDPGFWRRDGEPFTGTLTISHQGCAHYALLVVTGPARGRVTRYSDAATGPTFTDDPDFLAWYERWLDAVLAGARSFR
jgi:hypothetical protein